MRVKAVVHVVHAVMGPHVGHILVRQTGGGVGCACMVPILVRRASAVLRVRCAGVREIMGVSPRLHAQQRQGVPTARVPPPASSRCAAPTRSHTLTSHQHVRCGWWGEHCGHAQRSRCSHWAGRPWHPQVRHPPHLCLPACHTCALPATRIPHEAPRGTKVGPRSTSRLRACQQGRARHPGMPQLWRQRTDPAGRLSMPRVLQVACGG